MPRKAMEVLTESMFYVLMAFLHQEICGIEIAEFVEKFLIIFQERPYAPRVRRRRKPSFRR